MKTIKLDQELYLEMRDAAHSKFYTIAIQEMEGDGGYLLLTRRGGSTASKSLWWNSIRTCLRSLHVPMSF